VIRAGDTQAQGPTFAIAGFGDVDFVALAPEGENSRFQNGGFDLYATAAISDHWSALVELVFENHGNQLATDLERFVVSYERSNLLRLDAGRVHSPVVRWNVTQHHGVYLQTPVERPAIARFEDQPGLWPVHFVGLVASGTRQDGAGLSYSLGVGNGRGPILDEIQVGSDANRSKAVLLSLGAAPRFALGWEIDATAYLDDIPAAGGSIRERIYTASTSYLARGLEVRAEWSRIEHRPEGTNQTYRTTGWYVLASRRLPGRFDSLRPYLLWDQLRVAEDDAFLEGAPDYDAWRAGLRWDVHDAVALKGEYVSERVGAGERESIVRFQLAVSLGPNR
jgi:hypothetical protein